jgi:methionyl-tRNA formyltransferase
MENRQRIIFMGTPDFAVPSLKALNYAGYEIALVVTQPDRPKGRGRKTAFSPVKETALEIGCDIIQPSSVKTPEFHQTIAGLAPDVLVVVAFGHILTGNILSIPKYGAINLHASLLPGYRGPAPIQWAIINMEKETGVTAMLMNEGLDTGDILSSVKTGISSKETSSSLHDRLSLMAADLLIPTLSGIAANSIKPIPQENSLATYAPLLKKKDGIIDWKKPAKAIEAFIRGMTPWPGAFTFIGGKMLKIFDSDVVYKDAGEKPGAIAGVTENSLYVTTGKYLLSIKEMQQESGKRLPVADYLRGNDISPGNVLGHK